MRMTHGFHFILIIILRFYWTKGVTCPRKCKISKNCTAEDFGCPECNQAYYGRQCQHRIECRHTLKGAEYRGTLNTTIPGQICQRWDSQTPHKRNYNWEENYCRNPSGLSKPWCFTTDPEVRWQYCYVPICGTQCLAPRLDAPFVDIMNPPSSGFYIGFVAVLGCVAGYEHKETTTTTCTANKTWSAYSYPVCSVESCPSPHLNPNLKIVIRKPVYRHQDVIVFVCDRGYTMQGQSQLICQANKTWNHELPTCKANECPPPKLSPNSRVVSKSVFYYQDKVTITCDTGYKLQGSPELTCQANKSWDFQVPTCEVIICPLPNVSNANLIVNVHENISFNSIITFTCKSGYVLSSENILYCQKNEQWNGVVPTCVEADAMFSTSELVGLCIGSGVISATVSVICFFMIYRWKERNQRVNKSTVNETHYFEDIITSEIEEPHTYSTITDSTGPC